MQEKHAKFKVRAISYFVIAIHITKLTPWNGVLENLIAAQPVKKFSAFMEHVCSIYRTEPATGPYSEPCSSNTHHYILFF
jgi:hypothetical protein